MAESQPTNSGSGQTEPSEGNGSGARPSSETSTEYPKLELKSITAGANPRSKPKNGGK